MRLIRSTALLCVVASAVVVIASAQSAAPSFAMRAASGAPHTWVPAASMSSARAGQTATLLGNGDVLVAGGGSRSAELYNPSSGEWLQTGRMRVAQEQATATLLRDGNVLVVGGCCTRQGNGLTNAELYDPSTGSWSMTGSLHQGRLGSTATLLPDGDVLVAGGACTHACGQQTFTDSIDTAELYDPSTGTWGSTRSMHVKRESASATLLPDGKVLVAGGLYGCDDGFCTDNASAELYDPSTGKWTRTATMLQAREQHTATLLGNGDVLVAGGLQYGGNYGNSTYSRLSTAELYDPSSATWTAAPSMSVARLGQAAAVLDNGWVLVAGGGSASTELYEPSRNLWAPAGNLVTPRTNFTATTLPHGTVLAAGGDGTDGEPLSTAERFLPGRGPLVDLSTSSLTLPAQLVGSKSADVSYDVVNAGNAALTVDGVGVSGADPGDFAARTTCGPAPVPAGGRCQIIVRFSPRTEGLLAATVELFDDAPLSPQPTTVTGYGSGPMAWAPTGSMSTPRDGFATARLGNGEVLVAGGERNPLAQLASAEIYDPATGTWSATGSLPTPATSVAAVTLHNGKVLVAGGDGPTYIPLSSAELYNPSTGTWTATGSMRTAGYDLTPTLLPGGDVLVTGQGSKPPEVYHPSTGAWTATGPLPGNSPWASVLLLSTGQVLDVGGGTAAAELYDPTTNAWIATGSMSTARTNQMASLLPDGKVLVAGGLEGDNGVSLSSAEIYDPATRRWSATGEMDSAVFDATATLLPDGYVLVAGGCAQTCQHRALASTQLYDPTSGYWFPGQAMTMRREGGAAILLADGDVLAVGGDPGECCADTATAEVFTVPTLLVSPQTGADGRPITLSGRGFYAHERVTLTWDGHQLPGSPANTSPGGTFVLKAKVPPSAGAGTSVIAAVGQQSRARAETTFVVTSGA
jgi:WD40 repeat protein